MKTIFVSPNTIAIVDDDMFDLLNAHKWYLSNGYAVSGGRTGLKSFTKMHRFILDAKDGEEVDHKDRNTLNNCRNNLRIATREQNIHNQQKRIGTKNKYKGVSFVKRLSLYQARCRMNHKDYFLGYYKTDIAAAYAYNIKAMELSEFILLNNLNKYSKEYLDRLLKNDRALIKQASKTSNHNNIYYKKSNDKWFVSIRLNGKRIFKGYFVTDDEAKLYLDGVILAENLAV